MISGFVIYMSLEKVENGRAFIINRFSRLYPAYWASIVLTFCLVAIFKLPGREAPLCDALINFSMLQDWIGGVEQVDGAYWTLSRFVSFYFIVFLIHKFSLTRRIVSICAVWIFIIILSKLAEYLGLAVPNNIKLAFLLTEGSFFIIGIMFYMVAKYGNKIIFYSIIFCCEASILIVNGKLIFLASLTFSLLFLLFSLGYLRFINFRPLTWLGGISYSLYLIHQNIGYLVINKLKNADINFGLVIIIPTAISLLLATIINYYIEKPANKLLRTKKINSILFHRKEKIRAF
jgi:peptidoglycan/LPS O-acetylase OafA/YrhL